MLPNSNGLRYVLGSPVGFCAQPLPPFAPEVCDLLANLSVQLVADKETRTMPDVVAFAWWCRKANLQRLAATYEDGLLRLGRGLALHITPTNTPINFAFSWAFSLLAGNANIVRLPNRDFPHVEFLLGHLRVLFAKESCTRNAFIRYGHDEEITSALSALADVRLIWGGDATIQAVRQSALPARGLDLAFADRYSLCVLSPDAVLALDTAALKQLAEHFFNDTYLMDQNACSSPHLVVWLGGDSQAATAQTRFWRALESELDLRYQIEPSSAIDKFNQACRDAIQIGDNLTELHRADSRLYRVPLSQLFTGIEERRCGHGYFYEFAANSLDDVAPIVNSKYQTLTYFGLAKGDLAAFVAGNRLAGIDRIVPVGKALDIGLIWDGFDLIRTLSRVCEVS
jgi:hypothetical protein